MAQAFSTRAPASLLIPFDLMLLFLLGTVMAEGMAEDKNSGPKNVLMLIADDLRPQLKKAYGKTFMHTPNIDAFTDTALTFDWAYTNMAICSASRNSFMTGRVPDKTRVWNFIDVRIDVKLQR